jgi:hypothetical protein
MKLSAVALTVGTKSNIIVAARNESVKRFLIKIIAIR